MTDSDEGRVEGLLQKARDLVARGETSNAIELFEEASRLTDTSKASDEGESVDPHTLFAQCVAIDGKGTALIRKGKEKAARKCFFEAGKLADTVVGAVVKADPKFGRTLKLNLDQADRLRREGDFLRAHDVVRELAGGQKWPVPDPEVDRFPFGRPSE